MCCEQCVIRWVVIGEKDELKEFKEYVGDKQNPFDFVRIEKDNSLWGCDDFVMWQSLNDQYLIEKDYSIEYKFFTRLCPPSGIFKILTKKFPELYMKMEYFTASRYAGTMEYEFNEIEDIVYVLDEDMGDNCIVNPRAMFNLMADLVCDNDFQKINRMVKVALPEFQDMFESTPLKNMNFTVRTPSVKRRKRK